MNERFMRVSLHSFIPFIVTFGLYIAGLEYIALIVNAETVSDSVALLAI